MSHAVLSTALPAPTLVPTARDRLGDLYQELDAEVAALGPVCELSGRCCRFQEHGHTLFVSTAEFLFLLQSGPQPIRPLDQGQTCPWQDMRGRCTAREGRPLGCRVYFCDPSYQPCAHELSERYIGRLKKLTADHGLPWNYAPLHQHLYQQQSQGTETSGPIQLSETPMQSAPDQDRGKRSERSFPDL
jgi:hypothetical protein